MKKRELYFYIYKLSDYRQYQNIVCKIIEDAYQKGLQVIMLCENENTCQKFDQALWTFTETCFIPHSIHNYNSIITSNHQSSSASVPKMLLNASYVFPSSCEDYNQIVEMSGYDQISRQKARLIFKKYKSKKFKISSIHI